MTQVSDETMKFDLAGGWHLLRVKVRDHFEWIICDPTGDRLGCTLKHMAELDAALTAAAQVRERAGDWDCFNFDLIMSEAKMRHAQAVESSAAADTTAMRTMEYWIAHCAHANAVAVLQLGPSLMPIYSSTEDTPD